MKKFLFVFLLTFSVTLFAQKTGEQNPVNDYYKAKCKSSFEKILLKENNSETVSNYLRSTLKNLQDKRCALKLNYVNESPGGVHYSFSQTFNGLEIYSTEIKVNTDRANLIRSVFDNSENTFTWNDNLKNSEGYIVIHPQTHQPVIAERRMESHFETFYVNGTKLFQRDLNSYFNSDSVVSGKVFNPDPLTTAAQIYGGIYINNNDADAPWLDAQLQTVNFSTTFTGSQFILENKFVRVLDFDPPNIAPATSPIPQFYFNRSQSGFEDVNAFYHLNTIRNHITSLTFHCADSLIDIDTHAINGADNSYFSPSSLPHRIYYGTGGVNDAEDADVCVHEYGHSVSFTAAPGSNFSGNERQALDEGFGDYIAASYSKSLNTFNDQWVFNWDGHNVFWSGRVVNTQKFYPDSLVGNIFKDGQIWSTMLFALNGEIGRDATDSLILQTHYAYAQNISMIDAAQLLIDADTILTNGKYFCPIYRHLYERGLNPFTISNICETGVANQITSRVQFYQHENSFSLINPDAEKMQIELVDINGQIIAALEESQQVFDYSNSFLSAAVYLVHVRTHQTAKTFKWLKTN
jgi:hypothetical protein